MEIICFSGQMKKKSLIYVLIPQYVGPLLMFKSQVTICTMTITLLFSSSIHNAKLIKLNFSILMNKNKRTVTLFDVTLNDACI